MDQDTDGDLLVGCCSGAEGEEGHDGVLKVGGWVWEDGWVGGWVWGDG